MVCTVSGDVRLLTGDAAAGVRIIVSRPSVVGQEGAMIVGPQEVEFTADEAGLITMDLLPGTASALVRTTSGPKRFALNIPDAATADLADCLDSLPAMTPTLVQQASASAATATTQAGIATAAADELAGSVAVVSHLRQTGPVILPMGPLRVVDAVIAGDQYLYAVDETGRIITATPSVYGEGTRAMLGAILPPEIISGFEDAADVILPLGPKRIRAALLVGDQAAYYQSDVDGYVSAFLGGTGAVYDPGTVIGMVRTGQSLSIDSRGFVSYVEDGGGGFSSATVPNATASEHGDLSLMLVGENSGANPLGATIFPPGSDLTDLTVDDFTGVESLFERWDGGVLGGGSLSGFHNALLKWQKANGGVPNRLLSFNCGKGASTYDSLKRGTNVWASMMAGVEAAVIHCGQRGWAYRVGDLWITHGEAEIDTAQAAYEGYLAEWLAHFREDVAAITGQHEKTIRCYLDQCSTGGTAAIGVANAQLAMHLSSPDFTLVCPKYQFPYFDSQHMLAAGYVKVGEHMAKAKRFAGQGQKWDCLRPVAAVRSGAVVKVAFNNVLDDTTFAGPIGALVIDTVRGRNPGGNYGFGAGTTGLTISSVALDADGVSVNVTLSGTPDLGTTLEFAIGAVGAGSSIRDSDDRDISAFDADTLFNFAVGSTLTIA